MTRECTNISLEAIAVFEGVFAGWSLFIVHRPNKIMGVSE